MLTRRTLLRSVPAAAAATAFAGSQWQAAAGTPVRRASQAGLALRFVNNTGAYDNGSIHFYIVGTDLGTGQQVRITPEGAMQPVSLSDNGPDGYADYSIPFAGGDTASTLPGDMSGRIYFSLGDKLKFKVNEGNALAYPAGWVSTDPNYNVLHDCVEFTYKGGRIYCNTTMVDMFSVPLSIALTGEQSPTTGTLVDGGRANIFAALRDHPDFGRLVIDDRRVIAPGHGLEAGLFSPSYFDAYVGDVWGAYQSKPLTVHANNLVFTGQVNGDQFVFDGGVAPFARPSTRDVLFCDGALAAPNDGITGPVAAVLGAALNRTTLLDSADQPTTDPAGFYQAATTHLYSKVMHENTVDGKAYGFPFDDVGGFASYVEDNATEMAVTLTPF
ncbi:beta-1,3-glucanase family protein [Solicola gregarius]|uniref:Beta-1,3-glucanase family protein n=1 Tax=Solicola gregarius TaxID=2908642 RepID=A0AA46YK70_9ACTN|nr:beta-1,3-glucanase family protein [Solicola gregarius]UYM05172.1 beta-1,3-glucanase family protein [Solicola gregarius]